MPSHICQLPAVLVSASCCLRHRLCHLLCGGDKLLPERWCCSETIGGLRPRGSFSSSASRSPSHPWGSDYLCAASLTGPVGQVALLPRAAPSSSPAPAQRDFVVQVTMLVYYGLGHFARKIPDTFRSSWNQGDQVRSAQPVRLPTSTQIPAATHASTPCHVFCQIFRLNSLRRHVDILQVCCLVFIS